MKLFFSFFFFAMVFNDLNSIFIYVYSLGVHFKHVLHLTLSSRMFYECNSFWKTMCWPVVFKGSRIISASSLFPSFSCNNCRFMSIPFYLISPATGSSHGLYSYLQLQFIANTRPSPLFFNLVYRRR